MGLNIAGLVVNTNYEKDISKFTLDTGLKLDVTEEIDFEEASSNWVPDGTARIYFGDHGTLVFFTHDWAAEQHHSKKFESINFAYSESVDAYYLEVYKRGHQIRTLVEQNGEIKFVTGEKIPEEQNSNSTNELILHLINQHLGEDFEHVALSNKSFNCKITNSSRQLFAIEEVPETTNATNKWWQFWK